jgi:serine/threonine protein kinase
MAIKVMAKSNFPSAKYLELLYKEIEVMKKFNHPNMVRLLEVFDCSVNCYLVMELAEGCLRDQLDKKERMEQAEATKVFQDMAKAVQAMVAEGYIHRDVKP